MLMEVPISLPPPPLILYSGLYSMDGTNLCAVLFFWTTVNRFVEAYGASLGLVAKEVNTST